MKLAKQGVRHMTASRVRILGEDGKDVPKDGATMGEIALAGNTLMAGYYRDSETTEHAFRCGALRSEPACGSVRFIVPIHSPETSLARYFCFSSVETCRCNVSTAPMVKVGPMPKAMEAEFHISKAATDNMVGRACPPWFSGAESPFQPPSVHRR